MNQKLTVSLTRCDKYDSIGEVLEYVKHAVDLVGGMESFVSAGDIVLVKPNIGFEKDYTTGATTNPHVTASLCILARRAGARRIVVGDGAIVGQSTKKTFEAAGYRKMASVLAQSYGIEVELLDLKSAPYTKVPVPGGMAFHRLHVPEIAMEADVIIDVPVMKTHDVESVTLGLKNMKGLIREADKKKFHKRGLPESLVDLNRVVFPDLCVIDGTVGMEGLGPATGDPVGLGLLIASSNTLAADIVAAKVMGFEMEEVRHLNLASKERIGGYDVDWDTVTVVGLAIEEAIRPFRRHSLDFGEYGRHDISIVESGACSGCRHLMEAFLTGLEKEGKLALLAGKTVVFGQSAGVPEEAAGTEDPADIIVVGRCMSRYKTQYSYIPGCPPHPEAVKDFLVRLQSEQDS